MDIMQKEPEEHLNSYILRLPHDVQLRLMMFLNAHQLECMSQAFPSLEAASDTVWRRLCYQDWKYIAPIKPQNKTWKEVYDAEKAVAPLVAQADDLMKRAQ